MEQLTQLSRGEEPVDIVFVPHVRATMVGFQSLDEVDLTQVFKVPALVMKSIPKFMRGSVANNSVVEARGWKLHFLLGYSSTGHPEADCKNVWPCFLPKIGSLFCCRFRKRRCRVTTSHRKRRRYVDDMASPVSRASRFGEFWELKEMPLHQVMKVRGSC